MTAAMATNNICDVCHSRVGTCLHCTDLNHAVPLFSSEPHESDGLHEFQFFSHEDSVAWMFNDPKGIEGRGLELQPAERHPTVAPAGFKLFESFSQACDTDQASLGFDVSLNPDHRPHNRIPVSVEGMAMVASAPAASSATVMSFSGSTFTDAASSSGGNSKEVVDAMVSGQLQGDSNMDREAKVRRYKEKRTRRKFEKQIRYASRKAYAEMRPRIKGRFAKTNETETDTEARQQQAPPNQPSNSFDPNRHGFRWFHS